MDMETVKNIGIVLIFVVLIIVAILIQTKFMTDEEQKNYSDSFDEFLHGDKFR